MSDVQKVSIALTGEQISVLRSAVEAGEYATTSEIVREALREWQWKREMRSEDLHRLRAQWRAGKERGVAAPLNLKQTRERARRKLKETAEQRA